MTGAKSLKRRWFLLRARIPHTFPKIRLEFHPHFWWSFPAAQEQKQCLLKSYHVDICHGAFFVTAFPRAKWGLWSSRTPPVCWHKSGISKSPQSNHVPNVATCTHAHSRYHFAPMSMRKSESLPVKQILQDHHLENEEQAEAGLASRDGDASASHYFAKSKAGQFCKKYRRSGTAEPRIAIFHCFNRSTQRLSRTELGISSFETCESYS